MAAVRFSEIKIGDRVYRRYEFQELEELEEFFLHHVASARSFHSKVIGRVLLVWDREVLQ